MTKPNTPAPPDATLEAKARELLALLPDQRPFAVVQRRPSVWHLSWSGNATYADMVVYSQWAARWLSEAPELLRALLAERSR